MSVAAGSQRHERAGWDGPASLLPSLAAGSNALAPFGRGKGRDTPRHRTALGDGLAGGDGRSALSVLKRPQPAIPAPIASSSNGGLFLSRLAARPWNDLTRLLTNSEELGRD